MKKIFILFLVLGFALVGCSYEAKKEDKSSKESVKTTSAEVKKGYVFEVNGISIAMHAEAAPIIEKLGGNKEYFEAESCAFPGLEKTYSYAGFDLYTYEKDGVDYVASVVFTDDTVATIEGISLYATKEDLLKKHGDGYSQKMETLQYEEGESQLVFLIENDEVTSIEYVAKQEAEVK